MLLPFFQWCEATAIGTVIRESIWAFPIIEAIHLVGLCLLGGAILIVDLRLVGLGLTDRKIHELADGARPWLLMAIALMLTTGVLLFLSEAVKCYYNTSFWVKIITLPIALAFTFFVRGRVVRSIHVETSNATRLAGAASMLLWFTVAAAGRWIGFSG